jgi:signal transduction histidine kinase
VTDARNLERLMRQRERLASLGLLISGVAHEINNPNTFVLFNLPILDDYLHELIPIIDEYASQHADFEIANMTYADFKGELFKLVENISYGSGRIDTIVSRLREFSRIQDAQKLHKVDIITVLDQVATMADAQIKQMVTRFEKDLPKELPEIVTDRLSIEQMVLNLLINAGQAADKSDSWVSMKARRIHDGTYTLAIEIADNGSGLDDETLKRIFDPLFTTKGPDAGTGLGLYICHNLAQGLGGTIEVTSSPGAGSTFSLLLPDLKEKLKETELD